MTKHKSRFKAWPVTLTFALVSFAIAAIIYLSVDPAMQDSDNVFGSLAIIMIFSQYMGYALIAGVILTIITIILAIARK